MSTVVDFSAAFPTAESIKAAGHVGVVAYVSPPRASWMGAKPIREDVLREYEAAGLGVAFVWQFGKDTASAPPDVMRGAVGGELDAKAADLHLRSIGRPDAPVFFAVDFDITINQWNDVAVHYFRAAAKVLGKNRVGIYGHSRVCHWAGPEDKVIAEVAPGRFLAWQTRSWSQGVVARSYAVLYQRIIDTRSSPGPVVGGVTVDVNDVFYENWGQRSPATRPKEREGAMKLTGTQFPTDVSIYTRANNGGRDPKACQYAVFHTTENADTTPAENVARWQQNTANGSSYNVLFDTDGKTIRSNDDNIIPWSAGNPGNRKGLHGSALGYAARTREHWLRFPAQIESMARWAADIHLRYNMPLVWLSPADIRAGRRGFTSHQNVYQGDGGPAFRSDPGAGFPHDVILDRAKAIVSGEREDEDMAFTDEDRVKLDRIHHELTHEFGSRYPKSGFRDTLAGYILELDRKIEDIHANQLPWVAGALSKLKSLFKKGDE